MNQMPNWISGIGSLMAGATAVVVLIWQFWRARKGDQEKRDREERDQAGRITWWLEDVPDGDTREGVRDFAMQPQIILNLNTRQFLSVTEARTASTNAR